MYAILLHYGLGAASSAPARLPYSSSPSFTLDASLYRLLKGPVLRHYRLLQTVRLPREDSVLWYRCELPIQSPRERECYVPA